MDSCYSRIESRKAEKLVEELKSRGLCGEDSRNVIFDDLTDLRYLSGVIKEGMRTAHVAIGSFFWITPHDMTILGYRVPAGTRITFPSMRYVWLEIAWDDADVFRPGRWIEDGDMAEVRYAGFSYGPRDCIGQRLAMMEMKAALVRLISQYKFYPTTSFHVITNDVCDGAAIETRNGVCLKVAPRGLVA